MGATPEASIFVHLVASRMAATRVRSLLRRLCRRETVVSFADPLSVGPLRDVEEGADERIAWWERVAAPPYKAPPRSDVDRARRFRSLVDGPSRVLVWHGPEASERMLRLRTCWYFRASPERCSEVALRARPSSYLAEFYAAVAIAEQDELEAAWQTRGAIRDVEAHAADWHRLRTESHDGFRSLEGEHVVERPITDLDAALIAACEGGWRRSLHVLGMVMADNAIGDVVLCWRVRELLREGAIEGRGAPNKVGLPEELRPRGDVAATR